MVRYNNGLNTVALRSFTPVEMDIFWAICSKMKRQGTQELTFDFDVFKDLAKYDRREKDSFYNALRSTWNKMKFLNYSFEDSQYYVDLLLFQTFIIDKKNEKIIIQASERFEFILNSISSNFTRFELDNITNLKSSYSKELYRQLMQHRDVKTKSGAWYVKIDDFRNRLSIPESYQMTNIDTRILKKAEKEFCDPNYPIFSKFEVEKIKTKKGNKISSLRIYFQEFEKELKIPMHNWLEDTL